MNPAHHASPIFGVVGSLWILWIISWWLAARWSSRTLKTTRPGERTLELLLTIGGGYALMLGWMPMAGHRLFPLTPLPAWMLTALVACGFALCWWARLSLGQLWSMNITLKQDHRIIDTGPYAWVRHPIYTGILLAAWATAALYRSPLAIAGAVLMTLGFYLKARREEQLLTAELGAPYEHYAQRVPMLVPRLLRTHTPHSAP